MKNLHNLISRLRIAIKNGATSLILPYNKDWVEPLKILYKEGYIQNFTHKNNVTLVNLRYYNNEPVGRHIKNFTSSSREISLTANDLWRFSHHHTTLILSSNKGLTTGAKSLKNGTGGKLLMSIS